MPQQRISSFNATIERDYPEGTLTKIIILRGPVPVGLVLPEGHVWAGWHIVAATFIGSQWIEG